MAAAIKTWRSFTHPLTAARPDQCAWLASPWIGRTILVPMTACRKSPRKVWRQTERTLYSGLRRWERGRLIYNCELVSLEEGISFWADRRIPQLNTADLFLFKLPDN